MAKKRGFDQRQEPGEGSGNRIDRVFVPASTPVAITPRRDATQIATELLATSRTSTGETTADAELSLRRQLSRLQRQLAEAQRELANKDEEVAAEVEKRLETARELEEEREDKKQLQIQLDELLGYQLRTAGIEERLQQTIAAADELVQLNEQERATAAAARARVDDLNVAFEEARGLWNAERAMLEERSQAELAQLEAQRKAAVDAHEQALEAQAARLREAHETAIAELRAQHEQSLATLRGDLEPKALQAHSLAEERERLIAELAEVRNETIRDIVEIEETHKRELAQLAEANAAVLASTTREHIAELARVTGERDTGLRALEQAVKAAEARAQMLEGQADGLRQTLKNVQRETAELKERVAALGVDKKSGDEALERARKMIDSLLEDKRQLEEQLDAAAAETRRSAQERHRFVAYLEEGLALLGALPPQPEPPEIEKIEPPENVEVLDDADVIEDGD